MQSIPNKSAEAERISDEPRPLHLGLSLSATWLRGNAWRRVDSRVEALHDGRFHAAAARIAEEALFDFVFKPDVVTLEPEMTRTWPGFSSVDPTVLLAALVGQTERVGLVTTMSTAFTPPVVLARQLQSLHQLSDGRAGWNVVMSLRGAEAFGVATMPPSEERYAHAREAVDVVRSLWRSYPADALRLDRAAGCYADPGAFEPVDHAGTHLRVSATSTVPAHRAPIPIFQAGGSPAGVAFAGATADAVFAMAADVASATHQRQALRAAAEAAGRPADAVRLLPGCSFHLARTVTEARALVEASQTAGHEPGAAHWTIVGTPTDAVVAIERWADAGAIDGLIALPGGSWGSLELFAEEVVPRLRSIGLARESYDGSTLAEHLRLPAG